MRTTGFIRLKTDLKFWLRRNRKEIGGFGNPYTPWGFNSWMRTKRVEREKCEKLGLLKPDEKVVIPAEYAQWGISSVVQSMGRAGTSDLTPKQKANVVDKCKEEGIKVEEKDNSLQIAPDKSNPDDALSKLQDKEAEAWLEEEMKRLGEMSADDLLKEILGENA